MERGRLRTAVAVFVSSGELRHPGSRLKAAVADAVRVYIGLTLRPSVLTAGPRAAALTASPAVAGTKNCTDGGRCFAAVSSFLLALSSASMKAVQLGKRSSSLFD